MAVKQIGGSCLCGNVKYQINTAAKVFQYCHCTRCQKVTGSAHASNIILDPADFKWLEGEDQVGRYEVADAKYFATSFCKTCGSTLPWLTKNGAAMIVPAGTLDEAPDISPQHNIYYHDKASWYEGTDKLVKYDALPTKK